MNETQAVEQGLTLYQQAQEVVITTPEAYEQSAELRKTLKELDKTIVSYFEPIKKAAHESWKGICAKENESRKPIQDADNIVSKKRTAYYNEQERIRREAEAKAQREAEEVAKRERERLIAQAIKAEGKGKDEKAEQLLEKAENVYAEPVFIAPVVEKTTRLESGGTVSRIKDIEVTVVDIMAVIKAVATGVIPATVIKVDEGSLKRWVKASGVKTAPGVSIKETSRESVR